MSNPKITHKLLKAFAEKTKNPIINFDSFQVFVKRYADKKVSSIPDLNMYSSNTKTVLTADLEDLASRGICLLDYEDVSIVAVQYPAYLLEALDLIYRDIEKDPTIPFPTTDTFSNTLPDSMTQVVNVKNDFVEWIGYEEMSKPIVIRLEFPEGFKNMLLSSGAFFNSLLELSLQKIRTYLHDQSNFNYIYHKLAGILTNQEVSVQPFLEDIVSKPNKTVETILKPTEFTFRAWTTLGNILIHDIKQKASKLASEISLCQATYLIGFYNVRNKGVEQKKKETESSMKQLEQALKKSPYFFSLQEIYNLTGAKGVSFMKKVGKEKIHAFLEKRSKSEDKNSFPELIRIKTEKNNEFFINKDTLLILVLRKLDSMRTEVRNALLGEWMGAFRDFKKLPEMKSDEKYEIDIADRVKKGDPLLWAMLRFELLYLLAEEADVPGHIKNEIENMIDAKERALRPLPEILKLEREEMLEDVKGRLPVWMTTPVLSAIVLFLKRLVTSSKKDKKKKKKKKARKSGRVPAAAGPAPVRGASPSGAAPRGASGQSSKAKLVQFREHIGKLREEYVGSSQSVERTLEGLIEKWNTLLDPRARENLVEDVNSAIRDYLRRFKSTLIASPPDSEQLQRIAIRLAEQPIFSGIKRKEDFWRYIELYIIKQLIRE